MTQTPIKNHQLTSWLKALPKIGVVDVFGHRRRGKTATTWYLAEMLHKHKRKVTTFMFPQRGRKLLPRWVEHTDSLEGLLKRKSYVVVADEMAIHANAREHESDFNKELTKLLAIVAQCDQLLFLICQHTRQLDVQLVMDPDLLIMKQPSLLHIRFARPELRPEIQEAWDSFANLKPRQDSRAWAFVWEPHEGKKGFLRSGLPSFWSQNLSRAFALYEIAELIDKKKRKSKRRSIK